MRRASGELFQAVEGLRRAVEAEFTDNSYYLLSQQVAEVYELLGWDIDNARIFNGAHPRFTLALNDVRRRVEEELFDNRFYLVAHKLDVLSFLSGQLGVGSGAGAATSDSIRHASSPPTGAPMDGRRSFDDLAAASKARVEEVAAALGVPLSSADAHKPAVRHEILADGELERRSSEPCFLGELDPQFVEEMAPAGVSAKTAPTADRTGAAANLGSSAAEIKRPPRADESSRAQAQKEAGAQTIRAAATADDRAAASTGKTLTAEAPRKSFFSRLLGFLLGR